ncbi:hypothetical protein C6P40_002627 [Pichia californica]|uniref:Major facilitator superfamily (MFS) profile domain-containing protein n=1 Tax=Pichia californica TaxID=460514 RepID=A0A9P7BF28_9ASCO|nr:hypothetical protein C6P42_002570 [[Candida] californica]KAG0687244.1 hypothetical protein C6P40_002627 [[Candida] californica]
MVLGLNQDIKTDISIPGTTVLVGDVNEIKLLGLKEKKNNDEIILIPQPSSDPNDPLNWSNLRKHLHFYTLVFFSLILAASSNFVGPIYTTLVYSWDVSYNQLNTGGALTFLALAFSCLLCQPIASKFGRRPVYLFTSLITILSAVIFSCENSYNGYIGYSILVGAAAGPIDSLVEVSITDIFFLHQHGKYMGIYSLPLGLGSAFGPFIAGYADENLGYLWCGYLIIIICGSLLIFEIFFLEESAFNRVYESKIEDKLLKVAMSNISNNDNDDENINLNSINKITEKDTVVINNKLDESSSPSLNDNKIQPKTFLQRMKLFSINKDKKFSLISIIANLKVIRYPAVLWCSFAYGMQICWLSLITVSESEFFMAPPYNFNGDSLGLLSLAMVIGSVIGCCYSSCSDYVQIYFTKKNNGIFEPEFRLTMLPLLIFVNIAGIFMYGLGPYYGVDWIVGAIGITLISIALGGISSIGLTYVVECYPKQVVQTMTTILFIRNLMGMVFTWVFQYWLDGIGVIATTSMLAGLCLVINGSYIIIYIWGKNFRKFTQKWYEEATN